MIFGPKTETLPTGWKKVKSRSRPGEFSYENTKTGQVYSQIPPSLLRRTGSEFFDDEKDTTAKPFWQLDQGGGSSAPVEQKESIFDKLRGAIADSTSSSELE